jgi:hypothetical protein
MGQPPRSRIVKAHRRWSFRTTPGRQGPLRKTTSERQRGRFSRSVRLAPQVASWHAFNFVGFCPVNFQACHSKYQGSRRQAEPLGLLCCGVDFLGQAFTFTWVCHSGSSLRCEMKNPTYVAELQKRLGAPSSETLEGLRLLRAFLKLAPDQRSEVIEMVERYATSPVPGDPSLS